MFPEHVETDRLHLERISHDTVDLHEFYRICSSDPDIDEVTRHLTWTPHETIAETAEYVDRCEQRWADREAAEYVIRPRPGEDGAGEIAGGAGLSFIWDRACATPGIWLRKRFWGRGYSGERAAALFDIAFEHLDIDVVEVNHEAGNDRSRRAVETYVDRFGGQHDGVRRHLRTPDGRIVDYHYYTVLREEYAAATSE